MQKKRVGETDENSRPPITINQFLVSSSGDGVAAASFSSMLWNWMAFSLFGSPGSPHYLTFGSVLNINP